MIGIKIYKNTKVFVACPANYATGGPELLHQLACNLKKELNINAIMAYYPKTDNPLHPDYKIYNLPYVFSEDVEDNDKNIVIVPEIVNTMNLLMNYNKIRKGVWFLSVDHYYLSRKRNAFFFQRLFNKCLRHMGKEPHYELDYNHLVHKYRIEDDELVKSADFYMTNSYRGISFLKERGISPLYYLSEHLHENFLKTETDISNKEDIVVYNPKKGYVFTKKIVRSAHGIKFIPLQNMTRNQVIELLQRSKVYMDFGNHPGKDRLPREAAILKCCVITGKRGSAGFYKDVPVPEEYKFEDRVENIPAIISKIKDFFDNYKERISDFEHYVKTIEQEPEKFSEDLKKIFVKVK